MTTLLRNTLSGYPEYIEDTAEYSSEFPEYNDSIYARINRLNQTLPNIQKWAIVSGAVERVDVAKYDPETAYDLYNCVSRYSLGQIYELRQIMPLFYRTIEKDPDLLTTYAGDSSRHMLALISEFCQNGYRYSSTYDIDEDITCAEPDEEHFHLIPFPQRNYMNIPMVVWVLAFILEGFQYEFSENTMDDFDHQYFQFYARYRRPTKAEIHDYQETRILMDEYFDEIPEPPQPTPASPPTDMPNFPTRCYSYDMPNWWEPDY
jgi:hypothetical protein